MTEATQQLQQQAYVALCQEYTKTQNKHGTSFNKINSGVKNLSILVGKSFKMIFFNKSSMTILFEIVEILNTYFKIIHKYSKFTLCNRML